MSFTSRKDDFAYGTEITYRQQLGIPILLTYAGPSNPQTEATNSS